jgi:CMP/dCMP kinase
MRQVYGSLAPGGDRRYTRAVAPSPLVVAIDGPAGAGKSAAARELALRLAVPYLDTGAMYRAVALLAWRAGLVYPFDAASQALLEDLARSLAISFSGDPRAQRVLLDGEDVTDALRSPEVSQLASQVSVVSSVRRELVQRQRAMAADTGGVVEGRDIGTVVFPSARFKFFVTASAEVRAQRRYDELRRRGVAATWAGVEVEQRERDLRDASRQDSPMVPARDAVVVDTSAMTLQQVVEELLAAIRRGLDTASGRSL